MRKISVVGVFNKNINFIDKPAKKPTMYDLLFLVAIFLLKLTINISQKLAPER